MSIAHRVVPGAFSPRPATARTAKVPAVVQEPASRPYGYAGRITCSPWEGLYLEDSQTVASAENHTTWATDSELEHFLTSLMYGE